MKHQRRTKRQLFAETQMGIVTRYGDWFHTTTEHIEKFVPGLLDKVDLDRLVSAAQAWVKSADSISMILALILLLVLDPLIAAAATIVFHGVWYFNKSSFVVISLNKFLELLYRDGTQLIASLAVISYLGVMGNFGAAGLGLLFFFILKLGVLRKLWDLLFRQKDTALTLNDRVMKMVIIKFSMYEDLAPKRIRQMEDQLKELALSRKRKN